MAYMLRELAHGKKKKMNPNEFTHERISKSGVLQNVQSGDSGVIILVMTRGYENML
ncbi:hypothetical protein YC2023_009941 [Brassica napus]